MWFRRPLNPDRMLDQPQRLSTADYLCRLMEEQNALLRAFLAHAGVSHAVPRTSGLAPVRIRTDKDVIRVSQAEFQAMEAKRREEAAASWRASGPDTAPTPKSDGNAPPNGNASDSPTS